MEDISPPDTPEQTQTSSLTEKIIGNRGLTKRILRRGTTWQTPVPGDEVEVHYGGHIENGPSIGSSHEKGYLFKFKLGQGEVIEGLDEGVATMKKGEKANFKVPPHLAYGEVGFPPLVPPHSTLIFDVEMISWSTIRDITGDGGVLKKIIYEGEGWANPKDGDEVTVKYEAKLENGTVVSSSESVDFHVGDSQLCPAIHNAVKTMRRNEKAELSVRFSYGFEEGIRGKEDIKSRQNSTNTITIFLGLLSWRRVVDVLGDKKIQKKVITAGDGFIYPNEGSSVKDQLCPAIHNAVKTMRRNEKAELSVRFSYGFEEGIRGKEDIKSRQNSTNTITIFLGLLSWRRVVDVLGDKKIQKKVITAGDGFIYPNEGSSVKVIYVGKQENGTLFEQKGSNEEPFVYRCLEDQIDVNLDKAIMTMKKGEKALVYIYSDDMQGNEEVSEKILSSPRLRYEVELLDFTKEKPFWKMDTQEKIEACEKKKQEGNALFKSEKFWLASKKYERAVKCVEFNHSFSDNEKSLAKALLLSCNLNNAACKLKLEDYVGAAKLCTKVLELDPDNIKALFRRSQAYLHTSDLEKAEADCRRALTIDSNNRDIKLVLQVIKSQQKEHALYQAQLFGTMVSKLV